MTKIVEGKNPITLINVFTVAPEKADELVTLLDRATKEVMSLQPFRPTFTGAWMVSVWLTMLKAMQGKPEIQKHMVATAKLAEKFEPALYTVESVHGG